MKLLPSLTAALCLLFVPCAIAQEAPGNFWVNPVTGDMEAIDFSRPNAGVAAVISSDSPSDSPSDWVEIATLQGGDRLFVKITRVVAAHGRFPQHTEVQTRITRPNGRTTTDRLNYRVLCDSYDMQNAIGQRVAIEPGSLAEAVFNYACHG